MTTLKTMTRVQLGAMGEALAVDYLTSMGLRILNRNWRCRYGELDVIACDAATRTVVFVEVKTRTGDGYGGLAHAVTERKVRRLRRLAGLWLADQEERWAAVRIDVIGVRVGPKNGSGMARPGAVSRAHRGVLFLDECAEISLSALEALRTPLEDGEIRLARRDGVACYPARFQLVLAANPCPCAPADPQDCICAAATKRRYLGKLSGPLLDRVDLRVQMHRLRAGAFSAADGESTSQVRQRVALAREAAAQRWRPHGFRTNAEVSGPLLRRKFRPSSAAMLPLRTALDRGLLSIRGVDRTLRVAWSLADLAGRTSPGIDEVAAALSFRQTGARR